MSGLDLFMAALDCLLLAYVIFIMKKFLLAENQRQDPLYTFLCFIASWCAFELVNDLAAGFNYVMLGNFWLNLILFTVGGWYVGFMYRRHYHAK